MTASNSGTSREYVTGTCTIVQENIGGDNKIDRRKHTTHKEDNHSHSIYISNFLSTVL